MSLGSRKIFTAKHQASADWRVALQASAKPFPFSVYMQLCNYGTLTHACRGAVRLDCATPRACSPWICASHSGVMHGATQGSCLFRKCIRQAHVRQRVLLHGAHEAQENFLTGTVIRLLECSGRQTKQMVKQSAQVLSLHL